MYKNIRSQLFMLKQFGFSEKILDTIYRNGLHPLTIVFNLKDDLFSVPIDSITKNDYLLSAREDEFRDFVKELLSTDVFLKKGNNKIFFKYDDNVLSELLPESVMPLFMYAKGDLSLLEKGKKRIAIIGTRKPSIASIQITEKLTRYYVKKQYIIVSGLADGVDTISHRTALKMSGKTIAILPTNFSNIYPIKNNALAKEISDKGLLLSSIGPKEKTFKSTFLERNKYVANIADLILVIETNLKSGTMNTIRNAGEAENKILFVDQGIEEINNKIIELGGELFDENIE